MCEWAYFVFPSIHSMLVYHGYTNDNQKYYFENERNSLTEVETPLLQSRIPVL